MPSTKLKLLKHAPHLPSIPKRGCHYQHGPLKRVELADNLQGIDYVYNINGLLKSINNPNGTDPGGDGSTEHANFAADVFAMALDYYNNDYKRTGVNLGNSTTAANFDGNIARQRFMNKAIEQTTITNQNTWQYAYDDRNFMQSATYGTFNASNSIFTQATKQNYKVDNLSYDANGNILTLDRRNKYGDKYDQLRYSYKNSINRLDYVNDPGDDSEFDDDETFYSQNPGNYIYNTIGQLTKDTYGQDGTGHNFTYNVYGKVTKVSKNSGSEIASYVYDDRGFRIKKVVGNKTTWYTRDLSGNIMATYETVSDVTALVEMPIYGSGRVGLANATGGVISEYTYELTDHLGNVRATIKNNAGTLAVLTAADYYPGGMTMPGRTFNDGDYRFGYQGQFAEKDEETGYNQFEARLYDNRINRWLTTDPAGQFHSPYIGMGNNWPNGVDPDGGYVFFVGKTAGLGLAYIYDTYYGKMALDYFIDNPNEHIVINSAPGDRFISSNPNGIIGGITGGPKRYKSYNERIDYTGMNDNNKLFPAFNAPQPGDYTLICISESANSAQSTMHEVFCHAYLRKAAFNFLKKDTGELEHFTWLGYYPPANTSYGNETALPGSFGYNWYWNDSFDIETIKIQKQYKNLFPTSVGLQQFCWPARPTTYGYRSIRYL